jgi:hypothetical protein
MKALRFFIGCIVPIACLCVGCSDNGKPQNDDTSLDTGTVRDSGGLTMASDSDTSSAVVPDTTSQTADTLQPDTGTGTTGVSGDCSGVVCNTPPANQCDTNNGLIVYNATGWCSQGTCHYIPGTVTCDGACINGVCQGTPCQAVLCNSPPEAECLGDTNVLRVYGMNGSCSPLNGTPQCNYTSEDVVCEGGCADGQCIDAPCAHVVCDDPPARYCDGNHLVTWNNISRCEAGECIYEAQIVSCVNGCQDGTCVAQSACESVTCADPPAPYCADNATLRAFKVAGTCQDGFCFYAPFDVTCATSCEAGQCAGDLCAGVDCSAGPPMYCDADGVTLISWDGLSGTCSGGVCNYGLQPTTCVEGCESGSCRNDPCGGVTCDAPPADYCTGGQSAVQYISPGICVGNGSCAYQSSPVSCPMGCELGICLAGSDTGDTDTSTELDTGTVIDTSGDTSLDTNADTGTVEPSTSDSSPDSSQETDTAPLAEAYFFDDFEHNVDKWLLSGLDWNLNQMPSPSGSFCLSESPDGEFVENANVSATFATSIDLSASTDPVLNFWYRLGLGDAADGYDYVYVEVSKDGGTDWTQLWETHGKNISSWTFQQLDLADYKTSAVKIRFRLRADADTRLGEGWDIDDVFVGERDATRLPYPFSENFESGLSNWLLSSQDWGANDIPSPSGSTCLSDSVGAEFVPNANAMAMTAHSIDLSTSTDPVLSFWYKLGLGDAADGYDYAYVEVSQDGGTQWTQLWETHGKNISTWTFQQLDLATYKSSDVKVRFRLRADADTRLGEGWDIDDVLIGERN